jgi:hypothetical protein
MNSSEDRDIEPFDWLADSLQAMAVVLVDWEEGFSDFLIFSEDTTI